MPDAVGVRVVLVGLDEGEYAHTDPGQSDAGQETQVDFLARKQLFLPTTLNNLWTQKHKKFRVSFIQLTFLIWCSVENTPH